MKPLDKWKANKWRLDLREYTRNFIKDHFVKGKCKPEVGKIYALDYKHDSDIPTDKHHISPIILSFGRFKDDEGYTYVRGINLMFLKTSQQLEIMEAAWKNLILEESNRVAPTIALHEELMKMVPFCFKNFEERRILDIHEVSETQWGMIPLLKRSLLGNFNAEALNEDFQLENTVKPQRKKRPKAIKETEREENVETVEEDLIDIDFEQDENI